jgi:phosphatidylglycerophosphate synthase
MKARLVPAEGNPRWEIAGLGLGERTRRALAREGVALAEGRADGARELWVAGDALLEPDAVRALLEVAGEEPGAIAPAGKDGPAALVAPAGMAPPRDADALAGLAEQLKAEERLHELEIEEGRCQRVRSPSQADAISDEMLAELTRPTDGLFARHFDRRLSRRISVPLVRRGVHPNWITGVATLVGLVGAALLLSSHVPVQVFGALLFVLSTILDGCDGEVARLSLRTSRLGGTLDLIGDNLTNGAVFLAIGYTSLRGDPGGAIQVAVGAALAGLLLATVAGFWYSAWLDRTGRSEALRHGYESFASRDFAYGLVVLAAIGKLHWFVWAAAVGSNAFALLLVVLRLKQWPPRREGDPAAGEAGDQRWA